ncbi:MAG TPA: hypothetical protein VGO56_03400 [Pyrinomonadaceae bacterium]|jgi:hypothetical protein|nr:hypothetical protein [Pyrinomonadaceae bacterium]
MKKNTRQQLSGKIQQLFQLLLQHPEGLSTKDMWSQLQPSNPSDNGANGNGNNGSSLSFEEFSFFCVGPIKAGWLVVERNHWSASTEGKKAFENYPDAQQFVTEAGKRSTQGWLATHLPGAYSVAGKTKDQITSEVQTIRRVGVSRLFKDTFGKATPWREVLPIQTPRTVPGPTLTTQESLLDHLREMGAAYGEGSHAIYLPPSSLKLTAFASLAADYPPDAGLKIMKNPGGVDESSYLLGRAKGDSSIQLGMVHSHRHLSLVANLLHARGVGPRLYDLINLQCGDQTRTAYVVQDIGANLPSLAQCEAGIQKLRDLDAEGVIKVILPAGFADPEFDCPTCCGNALVDRDGQFKYVDFQNFLLGDYEEFLTNLATAAAEQTHFGDTNAVRGGRYLYQSVPGVKLPGKRDVASRMKTLTRLLHEARVSVAERLVLDVGCNIGMMMSQYLKLGAKWCHGWDRATTTPHTEQMLLALGCTRFSTTGTDITKSRVLADDLPAHAAASLDGCVISYLAVRGHLDWLDSLKQIPWRFMVYEGHEGETAKDFEGYLAELKTLTNFELGPTSTYVDGDSEERTVAILLRTT